MRNVLVRFMADVRGSPSGGRQSRVCVEGVRTSESQRKWRRAAVPGLTGRLSSVYTLSAPNDAKECRSSPSSRPDGGLRNRLKLPGTARIR